MVISSFDQILSSLVQELSRDKDLLEKESTKTGWWGGGKADHECLLNRELNKTRALLEILVFIFLQLIIVIDKYFCNIRRIRLEANI